MRFVSLVLTPVSMVGFISDFCILVSVFVSGVCMSEAVNLPDLFGCVWFFSCFFFYIFQWLIVTLPSQLLQITSQKSWKKEVSGWGLL